MEFSSLSSPQRQALAKLGIQNRRELLYYLPRRYEDRTRLISLDQAKMGDALVARGIVQASKAGWWRGGRGVFELVLVTESDASLKDRMLRCRWYGMPYLKRALTQGKEIVVFGKLFKDKQGWLMTHPEYEVVDSGEDAPIHLSRITPIYPLTEGVTQRVLRKLMYQEVMGHPVEVAEFYPYPEDLISLEKAIPSAHFPASEKEQRSALKRLVYDEFFVLQCILAERKAARLQIVRGRGGIRTPLAKPFLESLPFSPTGAQARVMVEIEADLKNTVPMHRLLQGDVGSGKTMVAVYAMLLAVERGEQAALMAPTEILAEQHFLNLRRWLEPLGVSVGLYTGSKKKTDRSPLDDDGIQKSLFQGKGSVVVGTHALLYDTYAARELGLVVIDEQHKFGVMQRLTLVQKGRNPDVLVMTATPIPRTMGMTLYGDLEISVLNELPPGRSPIRTAVRAPDDCAKVWVFMRQQVEEGRQAYVVYPLIEESEKVDAKAVQVEYERIRKSMAPHSVGLLHGRMKADEKEAVMREFREGRIKVLVSTPVIEVGVDVPNATLMVIENAERFGLAQLHQLRGRIGRGAAKSFCALIGDPKSLESWQRLKIMEETQDGFRIAEEDYKIRGPGNMFGTEQSGLPPLRVGDFLRDYALLQRARDDATRLFRIDSELAAWPGLRSLLNEINAQRKTLATVG